MKVFKLILGIVEICFLPALLILQQIIGYNAGIIHWIIGGLFFAFGVDNIRKALKPKQSNKEVIDEKTGLPKTINSILSEETKKTTLYAFIFHTYQSWHEGLFETLSDYYKNAATKDSPNALTARAFQDPVFKAFIEMCFEVREPEAEESFVTVLPGNFMLTNKCLYILEAPDRGMPRVILLCDMHSYTNTGIWMKKGNIRLQDGTEISFKLDGVPDEKRVQQLQKALHCEHLIEI